MKYTRCCRITKDASKPDKIIQIEAADDEDAMTIAAWYADHGYVSVHVIAFETVN